MDLGAYVQIGSLSQIAMDNHIVVDRLRGYRLMQNEQPMTEADLHKWIQQATNEGVDHAFAARPYGAIHPRYYVWSSETSEKIKRILNDGQIRWDLIHGKLRKTAKYIIKYKIRMAKEQHALWNKYAGNPRVLYIHSRDAKHIDEYKVQPWFLGGCIDWWDETYCDIYAEIQPQKEQYETKEKEE